MAEDWNYHQAVHVLHIGRQVVNAWQEPGKFGHFIAVDDLALVVGLTRDSEGVRVNVLAPLSVLPLCVPDRLLLRHALHQPLLLLLQPDHLSIVLLLVLLNRKQVISLLVPEKNADALKAEERGQNLAAIHDEVGVAALRADDARRLDRGDHFFLGPLLRHACQHLVQLGLNVRGKDLEEHLIEVGEAGRELRVLLPARYQLYVERQVALHVEDGVRHEFVSANGLGGIFEFFELRVGHRCIRRTNHVNELAIEHRLLEDQ